MLSYAHTYPHPMFSKSSNTQTLWVGLSFLAVGLILGMLISNGALTQNSQTAQTEPTDQVDPSKLETVSVSEDNDASVGDTEAPVTIVEFSDFQCPYCESFYTNSLPSIMSNYVEKGIVRIVFRDFPLPSHPQASLASQAAECVRAYTTEADIDAEYFKMHDLLFETQSKWSLASDAEAQIVALAKDDLNVDIQTCIDTEEMKAEVDADYVAGKSYGISGTPSFFINGKKLVGAWPYAVFEKVIEAVR